MYPVRHIFAYLTLSGFIIFILSTAITFNATGLGADITSSSGAFPDFGQYNEIRTLTDDQYPTADRERRVIMVGDVHGTYDSFQKLLSKLSYTPASDHLIHVGDIIAKGTHQGSLAVLTYMAQHNVTGVRGNHDQKVIEWRAWIDWIHKLPGGKKWLENLNQHAENSASTEGGKVSQEWIQEQLRGMQKWTKRIPKGWEILGDHYSLARDMTVAQYAYLVSLPLVLHIPSAHTYIVHAGLLPYDPTRAQSHHRQPLSHVPSVLDKGAPDVPRLRFLQELAMLQDISQNANPWVKINMRSVDKHNKVIKNGDKGTPWSDLWNEAMGRCAGDDALKGKHGNSTTCWPMTVIYGHAATRGLDVKRWSFGTDSGCVYGRRLSALVLGSNSHLASELDAEDQGLQSLPYGDNGNGRIVSVSCP